MVTLIRKGGVFAMLNEKRKMRGLQIGILLFFFAEAVLSYLLQTVSDGTQTRLFSYAAVVLACLFCAVFASRTAAYALTQAALLCTVGADWFLVMCEPRAQLPAMLFFSGTQLCYFFRLLLQDASRRGRRVHIVLRVFISLAAILLTLLVLRERADAVALVSMFYYANLLLNIVFAFLETGISFFSVGLLLFALCDTLIGLSCIDPYLQLPEDSFVQTLLHPGFDPAWAFYIPSQALLAASLFRAKRREAS